MDGMYPQAGSGSVQNLNKISYYHDNICEEIERMLGKRIQRERKAKFLTQLQIASQLYVSPSTISQLENGRVFRNMDLFFRLCECFDLFAGELIMLAHQICVSRYYLKFLDKTQAES